MGRQPVGREMAGRAFVFPLQFQPAVGQDVGTSAAAARPAPTAGRTHARRSAGESPRGNCRAATSGCRRPRCRRRRRSPAIGCPRVVRPRNGQMPWQWAPGGWRCRQDATCGLTARYTGSGVPAGMSPCNVSPPPSGPGSGVDARCRRDDRENDPGMPEPGSELSQSTLAPAALMMAGHLARSSWISLVKLDGGCTGASSNPARPASRAWRAAT